MPRRRAPIRYSWQPAQKPVTAASSARNATSTPSATPNPVQPTAYATEAVVRTVRPIQFAKRGGRESSIGPSPIRGWTHSKYA